MDLPSRMLLACSLCLLPGKSPLPSVSGKKNSCWLKQREGRYLGKPRFDGAVGAGGREPGTLEAGRELVKRDGVLPRPGCGHEWD